MLKILRVVDEAELSGIGHVIIIKAIYTGFTTAIRSKMKRCIGWNKTNIGLFRQVHGYIGSV